MSMNARCSCAWIARSPSLLLTLFMGLTIGIECASAKAPYGLNDTGQDTCLVDDVVTSECAGTGQDAEFGRDVAFPNSKNGNLGFHFVKISDSGASLPSDATTWSCVKDRVTGLMWEVKTNTGGLRDKRRAYTNFGDGRPGDASEFASAVNAAGLCGYRDWRLPSRNELHGLVDYSKHYPGATIDSTWFPYTARRPHWTGSKYAGYPFTAWFVGFNFGEVYFDSRSDSYVVRLVRAGQ